MKKIYKLMLMGAAVLGGLTTLSACNFTGGIPSNIPSGEATRPSVSPTDTPETGSGSNTVLPTKPGETVKPSETTPEPENKKPVYDDIKYDRDGAPIINDLANNDGYSYLEGIENLNARDQITMYVNFLEDISNLQIPLVLVSDFSDRMSIATASLPTIGHTEIRIRSLNKQGDYYAGSGLVSWVDGKDSTYWLNKYSKEADMFSDFYSLIQKEYSTEFEELKAKQVNLTTDIKPLEAIVKLPKEKPVDRLDDPLNPVDELLQFVYTGMNHIGVRVEINSNEYKLNFYNRATNIVQFSVTTDGKSYFTTNITGETQYGILNNYKVNNYIINLIKDFNKEKTAEIDSSLISKMEEDIDAGVKLYIDSLIPSNKELIIDRVLSNSGIDSYLDKNNNYNLRFFDSYTFYSKDLRTYDEKRFKFNAPIERVEEGNIITYQVKATNLEDKALGLSNINIEYKLIIDKNTNTYNALLVYSYHSNEYDCSVNVKEEGKLEGNKLIITSPSTTIATLSNLNKTDERNNSYKINGEIATTKLSYKNILTGGFGGAL